MPCMVSFCICSANSSEESIFAFIASAVTKESSFMAFNILSPSFGSCYAVCFHSPEKHNQSPCGSGGIFNFHCFGAYPVCISLYISFLCCHSIHNDATDKQQCPFPPFKGNLSKSKRQYHPVLPEFYSLVFAGIFYNSYFMDYSLFLCNNDNFQLLP